MQGSLHTTAATAPATAQATTVNEDHEMTESPAGGNREKQKVEGGDGGDIDENTQQPSRAKSGPRVHYNREQLLALRPPPLNSKQRRRQPLKEFCERLTRMNETEGLLHKEVAAAAMEQDHNQDVIQDQGQDQDQDQQQQPPPASESMDTTATEPDHLVDTAAAQTTPPRPRRVYTTEQLMEIGLRCQGNSASSIALIVAEMTSSLSASTAAAAAAAASDRNKREGGIFDKQNKRKKNNNNNKNNNNKNNKNKKQQQQQQLKRQSQQQNDQDHQSDAEQEQELDSTAVAAQAWRARQSMVGVCVCVTNCLRVCFDFSSFFILLTFLFRLSKRRHKRITKNSSSSSSNNNLAKKCRRSHSSNSSSSKTLRSSEAYQLLYL